MRSVADRELAPTREFADEMSYCLGCLACQTSCPAGVQYGQLLEAARSEVELSKAVSTPVRSFWRSLTLENLFLNPRLLRTFGRLLRFYQNSGLQTLVRASGINRVLPENLRRLEPQTPDVAPAFSNELIQTDEVPETPRYRVALLTGCVQDLLFSQINRDTVDVLLANNCSVHTASEQPCCGSLHAHNGEPRLAATVARRLMDLVPAERFDAIITNAGGCGSHLRQYSALLADDPAYAQRALVWDTKVRDIHEWLLEIEARPPKCPPFPEPVRVTYHDSCHLAHGQKVTRQPRDLIRSIPGIELLELNEAAWCCGSAGVYNITQPVQSAELLARKIRHIQNTGARFLLQANPGCHLQIARGLAEAGSTIKVTQPVTLLAQAYRREADHESPTI
jgi:glycolate oxidase iron-sulfur subunit